jgi:hypothetical protein
VGDGQREEGRWSLSFNAWIAIAVGLLVAIVLGPHVPVYLTYRHEQKIVAEVALVGGRFDSTVRQVLPWPMWKLAKRWEAYGKLFDRASTVLLDPTATDADVARLAGLTKLQDLSLADTQVTNAGLAHLAGPTKLWWLNLTNTQVTEARVAKLKRALPGRLISR